jgi:glycosyltransferase involved in cell wall biosynthesis
VKVVQVIDSLRVGGAQSLQLTFAHEARRRSIETVVVTLRANPDSSLPEQLRALGARVETVAGLGLLDPRQILSLARLLRRSGCDVVHTHLLYSNVVGILAGRLAGVPTVATLHDPRLYTRGQRGLRQRIETLALKRAHAVEAVGTLIAEAHQRRLPGVRLHVIPNAVITSASPLGPEERESRRRQLSLTGQPVLIAVGRLIPEKAYDDMLRAFALVRERHPEAVLLIVGNGVLRAELERLAAELSLAPSVRFLGQRTDVIELLQIADVFLSSSLSEGRPIALLEAMTCGLPLVVTGVGEVAPTVADAGIVLPPAQPARLAAALLELLSQPQRRDELGSLARARVIAEYSAETYMDRLLRVYREAGATDQSTPA